MNKTPPPTCSCPEKGVQTAHHLTTAYSQVNVQQYFKPSLTSGSEVSHKYCRRHKLPQKYLPHASRATERQSNSETMNWLNYWLEPQRQYGTLVFNLCSTSVNIPWNTYWLGMGCNQLYTNKKENHYQLLRFVFVLLKQNSGSFHTVHRCTGTKE